MKPLILLVGLFMAFSFCSSAQKGTKLGITIGSSNTICVIKGGLYDDLYYGPGYNIGSHISYGLSDYFVLVFQPKYDQRNIKTDGESVRMNFYNVQGGLKLRIPTTSGLNSHLAFYGLPSMNYFLKGYTYFDHLDRKVDLKGQINTLTFYFNFGIGLEHEFSWGTIQLTGLYNQGLNNLAENNFKFLGMSAYRDIEVVLNGFSLNLGYLF